MVELGQVLGNDQKVHRLLVDDLQVLHGRTLLVLHCECQRRRCASLDRSGLASEIGFESSTEFGRGTVMRRHVVPTRGVLAFRSRGGGRAAARCEQKGKDREAKYS